MVPAAQTAESARWLRCSCHMRRESTGTYEVTVGGGETVRAFVPHPLPPVPEVDFREDLRRPLEAATTALGRLDAVSELLPDATVFVYGYVRKEAVLSSQIEGTQSSLSDLMLHEAGGAPGAPVSDVLETSNAVAALNHGVERLRGGFPLSNRLMREMHARLLATGRGAAMMPVSSGDRRTGSVVRVRATPPSFRRRQTMSRTAWRGWSASSTPRMMDFPFSSRPDWHMCSSRPSTRSSTATVGWDDCSSRSCCVMPDFSASRFCTSACTSSATGAPTTSSSTTSGTPATGKRGCASSWRVLARWRKRPSRRPGRPARRSGTTERASADWDGARVRRCGCTSPLSNARSGNISHLAGRTGLSGPTVAAVLRLLEELDIVREVTGRQRGKIFTYERYLAVLREGTEEPPG